MSNISILGLGCRRLHVFNSKNIGKPAAFHACQKRHFYQLKKHYSLLRAMETSSKKEDEKKEETQNENPYKPRPLSVEERTKKADECYPLKSIKDLPKEKQMLEAAQIVLRSREKR